MPVVCVCVGGTKQNKTKSQGMTDPAKKLAALQSAGFKPTLYTLQAGNSATHSSQPGGAQAATA